MSHSFIQPPFCSFLLLVCALDFPYCKCLNLRNPSEPSPIATSSLKPSISLPIRSHCSTPHSPPPTRTPLILPPLNSQITSLESLLGRLSLPLGSFVCMFFSPLYFAARQGLSCSLYHRWKKRGEQEKEERLWLVIWHLNSPNALSGAPS